MKTYISMISRDVSKKYSYANSDIESLRSNVRLYKENFKVRDDVERNVAAAGDNDVEFKDV